MSTEPLVSEEAKRTAIREELGLPPTAQASDVIRSVVETSGHTVTLLELMQLAQIMDGCIQLYVEDNESAGIRRPDK